MEIETDQAGCRLSHGRPSLVQEKAISRPGLEETVVAASSRVCCRGILLFSWRYRDPLDELSRWVLLRDRMAKMN